MTQPDTSESAPHQPESHNSQVELIAPEAANAKQVLRRYGIAPLRIYLHGSAIGGRLRTVEDDPNDPSDLDLLAIVDDPTMSHLKDLSRTDAPIDYRQSPANVELYVMKLPSATGKLSTTDIHIYSSNGLDQERQGAPNLHWSQFANSVMENGVLISD